jgi:predicted nuclease of predicted toxin-antitoxin system
VKLLIDMNLSPAWVQTLEQHGHTALHWSTVGEGTASDSTLLKWANENGCVVFTNDLDFGAILAATGDSSPSVIQVRAQDVTPERLAGLVVRALAQHESIIEQGALITIDEARSRVRILPLRDNAG